MRFLRSAALAATLTLAFAPAAVAQGAAGQSETAKVSNTRDGVTLPEQVQVGGQTLQLTGMGLRKKFVVKVYVAGFYLPQRVASADEIWAKDMPRRVAMQFLRGVSKDQMCGAMYDGLENNTPNHGPELKAKFDRFCEMMPAKLEKGDQLVFTYVPGQGTTIAVNDKEAGVIEGKDFGDALFKSYVGPKPGPGDGFKKDVLGLKS